MPLQLSQRNEVFRTIQVVGLEPADFEWLPGRVYTGSQAYLLHEPTGANFNFIHSGGTWRSIYEPGVTEPSGSGNHGSWPYLVQALGQWLQVIQQEQEQPDLWASLERQKEILGRPNAPETENTPFTAPEREIVAAELRELKQYIRRTYELDSGQYEILEARLDHIEAASAQLGRIDWWNLLVGSLVSLVLGAVVPANVVQSVLVMVAHGLAQLFGGAPPELPMA